MNNMDRWHDQSLSLPEREALWAVMSGEERKTAWQEHYAQQRQQATPPMTESERNFQRCMEGVDPNSKWGQIMEHMKSRGCFDSTETRTIVDADGIHQVRVKV